MRGGIGKLDPGMKKKKNAEQGDGHGGESHLI